jgi:hypothetical protein
VNAVPTPAAATTVSIISGPTSGAYSDGQTFRARVTSGATPIVGDVVVFDLGGQQTFGITDANGEATATITPFGTPGTVSLQVTYRGSASYLTSTSARPFTITRQGTSLSSSPATTTITPGSSADIVASLRDASGRALGSKPVVFTLTSGTTTFERLVIADAWGDARLGVVDVPDGTYSVTASFGTGQSISILDPNYSGSQAAAVTLTIQTAQPSGPVVLADMGVPGLEEIGIRSNLVVINGSYVDPTGAAPYRAWVRWTSSGSFSPLAIAGNGKFVAAHLYGSSGTRTVTVRICDAQNNCGTDDLIVRSGVSQKLTPVLQCVVNRGPGNALRYQARYGYDNPAAFPIYAPTVTFLENTFSPLPGYRGQPQVFLPGSQRDVFTVDFNGSSLYWKLHGTTVRARSNSPRC